MQKLSEKEQNQKQLLNESQILKESNCDSTAAVTLVLEGKIDKQYANTISQEIANKIAMLEELSVFEDIEVSIKIKK